MMVKKFKKHKSALTLEDREIGRKRVYILIAMILVGLLVAIYKMQ